MRTVSEARNEGARLLSEKLAHGDTQELAKRIGVDPSVVSRWASGQRKPRPDHRAKLEDDPEIQIPWRLWDEIPEEPESKGAA